MSAKFVKFKSSSREDIYIAPQHVIMIGPSNQEELSCIYLIDVGKILVEATLDEVRAALSV